MHLLNLVALIEECNPRLLHKTSKVVAPPTSLCFNLEIVKGADGNFLVFRCMSEQKMNLFILSCEAFSFKKVTLPLIKYTMFKGGGTKVKILLPKYETKELYKIKSNWLEVKWFAKSSKD